MKIMMGVDMEGITGIASREILISPLSSNCALETASISPIPRRCSASMQSVIDQSPAANSVQAASEEWKLNWKGRGSTPL